MSQGFCRTPEIFNSILRDLLDPLKLDSGVLLLQYVDDDLLAIPTAAACSVSMKRLPHSHHTSEFVMSLSRFGEKLRCQH